MHRQHKIDASIHRRCDTYKSFDLFNYKFLYGMSGCSFHGLIASFHASAPSLARLHKRMRAQCAQLRALATGRHSRVP
jgi:hypothetical protein